MAQNRPSDSFANATTSQKFHARQKMYPVCEKMKPTQQESERDKLITTGEYICKERSLESLIFRVHAASERKVGGTVGYANYFRRDVCVQLELHERRVFIWCLRAGEMNSHPPRARGVHANARQMAGGGFICEMRSRHSSGRK